MDRNDVRALLIATGEEITDNGGATIGYVAQPARFRIQRPYLARGGFLVVVRDEETGEYTGTEYDALPHPTTGSPYPAGHSALAWHVSTLEEAVERVMAYQTESSVQ